MPPGGTGTRGERRETSHEQHGTVLVVDDEAMVRDVVRQYLEGAGYSVETAADGSEALSALRKRIPTLVILDVMLPHEDGISVLRQLRRTSDVPVILLTARASEGERVAGLELGADDYVTKPFSPRELVARVRSVLRRAGPPGEVMEFGELVIDPVSRQVSVEGRPIDLTRKEFDLLAHLASAPQQVFSRADLLRAVWDSSPEWQDPSTVTTHVRRLRVKLEPDPDEPRWVQTAWGVGYRFEP